MSIDYDPFHTSNTADEQRELEAIAFGLQEGGISLGPAQARLIRLIMSNPSLVAGMLNRAHYDTMTGLYTKDAFEQVIAEALRDKEGVKYKRLIAFDWANFKTAVNDKIGQAGGNKFLALGGLGLRAALRYGRSNASDANMVSPRAEELSKDGSVLMNVAGRIGGDEMAVLLHGRNVRDISRGRVLGIALQTLIYPELLDWAAENKVENVGIRVATTMLDPVTDESLDDVLKRCDPKKDTIGTYSLIRDKNGMLVPVAGSVSIPRT